LASFEVITAAWKDIAVFMHILRWEENFGEDSSLILQDHPEDDTNRILRNIGF
jgi:hypothetical protein